jgi:ABC-type nitrate/sulfonate/bicarbonate transport system substrate-binding protein
VGLPCRSRQLKEGSTCSDSFGFGSWNFFSALAQDKFTLQLNWFQLADHSPIYLALKKGYYKEENIDLTIVAAAGSADSAKKVDLKQADLGISDAPT